MTPPEKRLFFVITQYSDYFLDYPRFFAQNKPALNACHIDYPFLETKTHECLWQGGLWSALVQTYDGMHGLLPQPGEEAGARLAGYLGILKERETLFNGFLFVCFASFMRCLPFFLEKLREPGAFSELGRAGVNLVWLMSSYTEDVEGVFRHDYPDSNIGSIMGNVTAYKDIWLDGAKRALAAAGAGACRILTEPGGNKLSAAEILNALALGVDGKEFAPVVDTRVPSRELFDFSHTLRLFAERDAIAFRKSLREAEGKNAALETFCAPHILREVQRLYRPGMNALLKSYGNKGEKLDWTLPSEHWKPYGGISEERMSALYREHMAQFPETLRGAMIPSAVRREISPNFSQKPLLTVLTMTKNHEKYIAECIESVLAQKTDFPRRHVIVDDCSSDRTREIISAYADKHPSIVPVRMDDGHLPGTNVEQLFALCRSKYAALCDGDDYFLDSCKLQKQVEFLEANPDCAICFHPVQVCYEGAAAKTRLYPTENLLPGGCNDLYFLEDLLKGNFMQTSSVVYRWRFAKGLPDYFRADLLPGDWYWHILHAETGAIGFINEPMSVYRRHPAGLFYNKKSSSVAHRMRFGMQELEFYDVINKHFHMRYKEILTLMASGVLADFVQQYINSGDDTYFTAAAERYPDFAYNFLKSINVGSPGVA
jgi:glycosyltransferase involved in cell wall biosynthesis